jgi:hypothetical protein
MYEYDYYYYYYYYDISESEYLPCEQRAKQNKEKAE